MSKKSKERIYKNILQHIFDVDDYLLLDAMSSVINDKTVHLYQLKEDKNIELLKFIPILYMRVIKQQNNWTNILDVFFKHLTSYVESGEYLNMTEDELRKEFATDLTPAISGIGISPDMLLIYLFYKRQYKHRLIPFLLKEYKKEQEKILSQQPNLQYHIQLDEPFRGSMIEFELNSFISESGLTQPLTDERMLKIAEKHNFKYDGKNFLVPRGFVVYFLNKLEDLTSFEKQLNILNSFLHKQIKSFNAHAKRLENILVSIFNLRLENIKLKKKIKLLQKQLNESSKIIVSKDNDNEIQKLRKQLSHAHSRIEQLEEKIALLEEVKRVNKEITENIAILDTTQKKMIEAPDYGLVAISGGKWNSAEKGAVEEFFDKYDCRVEFVKAEDTLKKEDLIENADLVIFDTSRHAHKYYKKIKALNDNVAHINKSKFGEVKKLFEIF